MKDDERTHSLLCASFVAFNKTRPTTTAVLALYFPITTSGEKGLSAPKIVWVDTQYKMHIVERKTGGSIKYTDPLEYDLVELECMEQPDLSNPVKGREFDIYQNYAKNFTLMHPVVLYARDAFNFDGSRPNLTLIETAQEKLRFGWKGPLILYAKKNFSESSGCQDITLSDFRSFLDFCKVYECSAGGLMDSLKANNLIELEMTNPSLFATMLLHFSRNRTFQGVEITCEGDKKSLNVDQFISVAVPLAHPIFDDVNIDSGLVVEFGATKVSQMIELPLLVRRILPDKRWNKQKGFKPTMYSNPVAVYLKLETEIQSLKWGFPDSGGPKGEIIGRVLVVREDQLAITAHQVEAVCAYFKKVSSQLLRDLFPLLLWLQMMRKRPMASESNCSQFPVLLGILNTKFSESLWNFQLPNLQNLPKQVY
jgi:hypothetical protein